MSVIEKLKEFLSEDQLKSFDETLTVVVNEKAESLANEKIAILEADLKTKYDDISAKYCEKVIAENTTKFKAEYVKECDEKLEDLEKKLTGRLASFLEKHVCESISDDIIEKIAINEVAMPIVEKIKNIFVNENINITSDGTKQITEAKASVKRLETLLSESMAKGIAQEQRIENLAVLLLIGENTEGLSKEAKAKVINEYKSQKFEEVESKIGGFVQLLKESESPKGLNFNKKTKITLNPKKVLVESITAPDGLPVTVTKVPEEDFKSDKINQAFMDTANYFVA